MRSLWLARGCDTTRVRPLCLQPSRPPTEQECLRRRTTEQISELFEDVLQHFGVPYGRGLWSEVTPVLTEVKGRPNTETDGE